MPGTSGNVGERRDGRRVAAVNDNEGSDGGGRGGGGLFLFMVSGVVGGRSAQRQESESYVLE